MGFLDNIYLDNNVRSYIVVAGTILLTLILKKYLSRYIASVLYRLARKVWKNVDKKSFVDLVVEPLEWLLLVLITVFAIDKLNFPEAWKYSLYGHSTEEIIGKIGIGIIIIVFTWFLLRIIDFIAVVLEHHASTTSEKSDDQLIVFFRDFLKVILGIAGLLLLIKACFNQPIGNLLTSLSIVGAVVALAAKESLENLIASFIIFFDKPFTAGDSLKVNNVQGTVERIGLRSTRIRTADKTLVTVPNKQMVDSVVDNWSMRTHRRAEVRLELSPKTNGDSVKALVQSIKSMLKQKEDWFTASSVYLTDLNKSAIVVVVEFFTQPVDMDLFNKLKEDIGFEIKACLEENQVELGISSNIDITVNRES